MDRGFLDQDFGSEDEEEEEEDFNPETGVGSDDEAGSDQDDSKVPKRESTRERESGDRQKSSYTNGRASGESEDDGKDQDRPPRKDRSRSRRLDDDDMPGKSTKEDDEEDEEDLGDEDEDDEGDDDDEDVQGARPRKRRKRGINVFFEEEAEVDEDDDDEIEEDEEPGFAADIHPDDLEQLPDGEKEDDRQHRELDRRRDVEASMDAERQAELFRSKYGRRQGGALAVGSFVPQNLLMPDVNDPSIWGIKCKIGKEREVVFKIMQKFMQRTPTKNPMRICSAFERGSGPMAGYIFVEARRPDDILDALDGITDCYPRGKTNLVPVKEMPDLLRVTKSKELVIDGYIRIKRGIYQGDLAVIQDVEENGVEVTVRLVPRLTYGLDEDDQAKPMVTDRLGGDAKRKRFSAIAGGNTSVANRPPQRLFNESEAKKRHAKLLTRGMGSKSFNYRNESYENGFLIKTYKVQHLVTLNVNPKLDEITKLTQTNDDGTETLDLEALAQSLRNNTAEGNYVPGDEVEVFQGELRGSFGRVEGVNGNIVSIQVSEGDLKTQVIEVPVAGLRKRFREGDHVKIMGGSRYRDEIGMVIRIKDDRVTVLTDTSMQEITVFSKDLREATDTGTTGGQMKFDVQDLVQLDPATVAVVIKADRESVRVLDQDGSVSTRLPSQITKSEDRRNAVATDKNGAEIRVGDVVREAGGESKTGTILHIHRSYVFMHNRTQLENSGLWTTRTTNVITTAIKGGRAPGSGPDLSKMNPALQLRNGGANGGMAPPRTMGRDPLQGKQVKIKRGPYKGNIGLVKDTTDSGARIELQAKNKIVNVEKEHLMIIDANTGKTIDYSAFQGSRGAPGVMRTGIGAPAPRFPTDSGASGGRTPIGAGYADGSRTPGWGNSSSRTPAWTGLASGAVDSGRTPSWKPSGGQTSYGGAGNNTTYGGTANYGAVGGGRTPAWSGAARTPYGADHGFGSSGHTSSGFDAFAAGSRTPAYGVGSTSYGNTQSSRTPAWGGPSSASMSASTPGRGYDAPTPAASNNAYSAPTPSASANRPSLDDEDPYTPAAWSAPTPAANAFDAPTPAASNNIPRFAKSSNSIPLARNRFDAPTPGAAPAANAPTPYASGGYDAPTPAVGGGGGPRYAEDSDDE